MMLDLLSATFWLEMTLRMTMVMHVLHRASCQDWLNDRLVLAKKEKDKLWDPKQGILKSRCGGDAGFLSSIAAMITLTFAYW